VTDTKKPDPSREEKLTSRETAMSAREDAGDARDDAATLREDAGDARDDAATMREEAGDARDDAATLREEAVRAREDAAHVRSELDALMHQLRDANEHLIVANLRSQSLAEEADRANHLKDDFIAMVSHELRTPLNAVLGWARMLTSRQLSETRATHAMETIERNAAALALIIDDLLDMSRIIAGTMNLTFQPVDLMALTAAAVDGVRPAAVAKHIDLRLSADASLADVVNGDPGRLKQIVWNVLTNAIKFTPDGGRVDVSVEHVGSQMEVKVVDTGRGISADFLPQVFERFLQADKIARQQGGLGLGLAIVRQLVDLHGGTVHAASKGEGRGATFTIRLPILTVAAPVEPWTELEERRLVASLASPRPRLQRLDGVNVLVVDDQADGRTLTSLVLTEAGASVNAVASAREALQWLEGHGPDVLLTDIGLPEEDGYALLRQIRQHEAEHGGFLPAIALTGFARAEDRTRILAAGFQAHVPKPLDHAELTAAIAAVARGSATTGQ
jgi:signal transduction histidine kinase/ActR/RegA family two-component response regulator